MPENQSAHQEFLEKAPKYIVNQISSSLDLDTNNEWKIGFLIAYNVHKIIIKQNYAKLHNSEQISVLDPWEFEQIVNKVYDGISGLNDHTLDRDFDDIMEDFVLCWDKIECSNPVVSSFIAASNEFVDSDRSSASKRSKINEKIVKRMCEILSMGSDVFFIPTRELGSLLNQNRNYASIKLNNLVKDGFLIKVNDGNRRMSPHYKLNQNINDPSDVFVT